MLIVAGILLVLWYFWWFGFLDFSVLVDDVGGVGYCVLGCFALFSCGWWFPVLFFFGDCII